MGTNNDILQNDSFTFSEECRKAIQYYFSLFTFIVMDYHDTIGEIPTLKYFYDESGDTEKWLFHQLQCNVLFKPDALQSLLMLRNKLSNLLMQSKAVYQKNFSFISKDLSLACASSLEKVLAFVDNEINDLQSLQACELESVVTSSSQTSNAPEKALNEPAIKRESFQFDVTEDVKFRLNDLFNFLKDSIIKVEDEKKDFATFRCCLFGGDVYPGHKIKLKPKSIKDIACFFGSMVQFTDYHNTKATYKETIRKWFVDHNGDFLKNEKHIQDNTREAANPVVWKYVKNFLDPDKKKDVKGSITKNVIQ